MRHHDVEEAGHRADRAIAVERRHRRVGQFRRETAPRRNGSRLNLIMACRSSAAPAAQTSRAARRAPATLAIGARRARGDDDGARLAARRAARASATRGAARRGSARTSFWPARSTSDAVAAHFDERPGQAVVERALPGACSKVEVGGPDDAGRRRRRGSASARSCDAAEASSVARKILVMVVPLFEVREIRRDPQLVRNLQFMISNDVVL